jgi:GGDEF domain-containing protein
MSTQTQLRRAFLDDLPRLADPAKNAWLIKGDFDHFKLVNDLYGCLLADTILDWSIEVIASLLEDHQKRLGPLLWNVVGDDLTIYIPPCTLSETEVAQLLNDLRNTVWRSFYRRYAVCALAFPADFFTGTPLPCLAALSAALERQDIVIDFAPRRQGFLVLFPVALSGPREQLPEEVIARIEQHTGKRGLSAAVEWDWLHDPAEHNNQSCNAGFIFPASISFAGWSTHCLRIEQREEQEEALTGFERLSRACQASLKTCKQQQNGVLLNEGAAAPTQAPALVSSAPLLGAFPRPAWVSERYLREKLYFRWLERPLLFQINPVYRFASGAHAECMQMRKYRGNAHGIGLKGINDLCGQETANNLIRQLILVFAEALRAALGANGSLPDQLLTALFVDRITVFCEYPSLSYSEIVALGKSLITVFNASSEELKLAHLRISLVESPSALPGYMLWKRLTQTRLSTDPVAVVCADEQLEVRRFCQTIEQEANLAFEANAFAAHATKVQSQESAEIFSPLDVSKQHIPGLK